MEMARERIVRVPELDGKTSVFADRDEAGRVLAPLVAPLGGSAPILLAVPAGGVPVAAAMVESLGWELDVAVVSKITLPWNTEAGYGAVAFDGTVLLNEPLVAALGLSREQVRKGAARTKAKVRKRMRLFRGERPFSELAGRTAVLVDDGLASGFTLLAAVEALRKLVPGALVVAVPTGYRSSLETVAREVSAVCCANVRGGTRFAVASAYRLWRDVTEEEALDLLRPGG